MVREAPTGEPGTLSLAEALAAVGGVDLVTAEQNQIRIFRGGWKCPVAYTVGMHEVYKYGEAIFLKPGDRIFVAPTGLATYRRMMNQIFPLFGATNSDLGAILTLLALTN